MHKTNQMLSCLSPYVPKYEKNRCVSPDVSISGRSVRLYVIYILPVELFRVSNAETVLLRNSDHVGCRRESEACRTVGDVLCCCSSFTS